MPPKQSVFIGTSLDGFIARANDDIDWLTEFESAGEDYGFKEFMDSVDALVMGRNTFEVVKEFGEWPYGPKKVIVLSSNESLEIPERFSERVNVMSGSPQEIVYQLAERALFHLYIDGGKTIQRFLNAGLIQEMTITHIPILIGEGIPLFGPLKKDIKLEHLSTQAFENGLVQSRYKVKHDD